MSSIEGLQMKPESESRKVLSITQSKAKMYEYNVPLDSHISLKYDPAELFILTIGLLGDLAASINFGVATEGQMKKMRKHLPFSAKFFDNYVKSKLNQELDPFVLLLGSAAYYLCNMPGSSNVLAKRISFKVLDLSVFGLDRLLLWFLLIEKDPADLTTIPDSPYVDLIRGIYSQFLEFLYTGKGMNEILEVIHQIRAIAYESGTPRILLISDLIGAVVHKRLENSTWTCLTKYTNISTEDWVDTIRKETFITEFWPAQHLLGKKNIFRGFSGVIQMPTSAGKTKATEIILRSAFLENRTSLAVIIAPFRALCHEIRQGLKKAFQGEDIFIDELSDVLQMDFSTERVLRYQQVLIATPEKFSFVLRHAPELVENIGLVIYDEGHQFDNGSRGITYELLLTSLKDNVPETAQIILISAVISNAIDIGEWLIGGKTEPVVGLDLLPTYKSIGFATTNKPAKNLCFVNPQNPDEEEFWVPRIFNIHELQRNVKFPRLSNGKEIALYLGLILVNQGGVAVFCGRKDSVQTMCERLLLVYRNGLDLPEPVVSANRVEVQKLTRLHNMHLGETASVSKAAAKGIFSHHNNIPHGIRLAVEYAMKERLINFVICTSTLAQGVNLPIRYLLVTSVYQGRERIMVRDFQNLIGRSGRSGMHTEGSILFTDPEIYDNRKKDWGGRQNWKRVKALLDPSSSEDCDSSLLLFFEPFVTRFQEEVIEFNPLSFVDIYLQGRSAIQRWIDSQVSQHGNKYFTQYDLQNQVVFRTNIISSIESYLMANWDPSQDTSNHDNVIALAKGTLAHFLADEERKEQIEDLFIYLAEKIKTNVPELPKRIIYGKTSFGVPDILAISNWLDENIEKFHSHLSESEIFEIIWPLMKNHIHNSSFIKCEPSQSLDNLAKKWINGMPFFDIYTNFIDTGVKYMAGSQPRDFKIDQIVDICENGLAFEGILLLGAITELIPSYSLNGNENIINTLQLLQKQLKYGLSNHIAIILYELGFADRVLAMEMSTLFDEISPNKDATIRALKAYQESVFSILDQYPSYFSQVYKNVAT